MTGSARPWHCSDAMRHSRSHLVSSARLVLGDVTLISAVYVVSLAHVGGPTLQYGFRGRVGPGWRWTHQKNPSVHSSRLHRVVWSRGSSQTL